MTDTDEFEGAEAPESEPEPDAGSPRKRRKESVGQTIGGVMFGFEQQVLRTMPPSQELVHHARPDAPIPAGNGALIHIGMPGLVLPEDGDHAPEADGTSGPSGPANPSRRRAPARRP